MRIGTGKNKNTNKLHSMNYNFYSPAKGRFEFESLSGLVGSGPAERGPGESVIYKQLSQSVTRMRVRKPSEVGNKRARLEFRFRVWDEWCIRVHLQAASLAAIDFDRI